MDFMTDRTALAVQLWHVHEFDPRSSEWDFGFHEDRRMSGIPGNPYPQACVGEFLSMIKQADRDTKRRKIARGDADVAFRRVHPGDRIVQASSIKNRCLEFRNRLPICRAQGVEKTDGVLRSGNNPQCGASR